MQKTYQYQLKTLMWNKAEMQQDKRINSNESMNNR